MFTTSFWKASAERAISTTAQSALALTGVDLLELATLDWKAIAVASLIAGGLSVLKALAAGAQSDGTPSFSSAEVLRVK